tara:strand:+ start:1276 stop:1416 length:141 start_codon:yes stop_codon:yes gene_type:complete
VGMGMINMMVVGVGMVNMMVMGGRIDVSHRDLLVLISDDVLWLSGG